MGYSSGVYTRTNGINTGSTTWQLDRDSGAKILATRHDAHDQDVATALSNCLLKDGTQTVTANIPMAGFKVINVGTGTSRTDGANVGVVQDGAVIWGGSAGGVPNAFTISLSPAVTSLTDGMTVRFIAPYNNLGATTLAINGLIARTIYKKDGLTNLEDGDIKQNQLVTLTYYNLRFYYDSPTEVLWKSWTPTYSGSGSMTFSTVTTEHAKYCRIKNIVFFSIRAVGTTGVSTASQLRATLPLTPLVDGVCSAYTTDGGGAIGGFGTTTTGGLVTVSRYDGANYALGSTRYLIAEGFYEVAS